MLLSTHGLTLSRACVSGCGGHKEKEPGEADAEANPTTDLGYDLSYGFARAGTELIQGIGTGGASKAGFVLKGVGQTGANVVGWSVAGADFIGNANGAYSNFTDAQQNGLNVRNGFGMLFSAAGLGGNIGGALKAVKDLPSPKQLDDLADAIPDSLNRTDQLIDKTKCVTGHAVDSELPLRPPKTVYHQGDLSNGVSGSRPLSTSPDSDLKHYHPDGDLYRFEIPSDVFDQWLLDGSIQPFTDYHLPSGIIRPEIRIMPPASGSMNDFLIH